MASRLQKPKLTDTNAAAISLALHSTRALIASGRISTLAFPIFHTGGNSRQQNSFAVPLDLEGQRFGAVYCGFAKSIGALLFTPATVEKTLHNEWRRVARGYIIWNVHASGDPNIEEAGFSLKARQELVRGFPTLLSPIEKANLADLLGTSERVPA